MPLRRAAHDARAPADALPACRRHRVPAEPDRRTREQRHHVVTVEVAVGEREQAEQPTPEHALGERADGGAVVRDAGGVELLVHEPRVRLGGAVEDRHPLERHAVDERRHHEPDRGAHFVVGIGRRDDLGAVRRLDRIARRRRASTPRRATHGRDPGVGALDAGDAGDDRERARARRRHASSAAPGSDRSCGRYSTIAPRSASTGLPVADRGDRGVHQVALVVPLGRERARAPARYTRTTSAARCSRAREPVERGVVALRQLAVRVDERLLGGRVLARPRRTCPARRASTPRTAAPSTGVDTGRRPAAASRGAPSISATPVHGEERDARDADAAIGDLPERARPEHAPRRDADVVRGHDDAHRRERVAVLPGRDRVAQRLRGRQAP